MDPHNTITLAGFFGLSAPYIWSVGAIFLAGLIFQLDEMVSRRRTT